MEIYSKFLRYICIYFEGVCYIGRVKGNIYLINMNMIFKNKNLGNPNLEFSSCY